jgi:hypothetical protein
VRPRVRARQRAGAPTVVGHDARFDYAVIDDVTNSLAVSRVRND